MLGFSLRSPFHLRLWPLPPLPVPVRLNGCCLSRSGTFKYQASRVPTAAFSMIQRPLSCPCVGSALTGSSLKLQLAATFDLSFLFLSIRVRR